MMKMSVARSSEIYFSSLYGTNYYSVYNNGSDSIDARHCIDKTDVKINDAPNMPPLFRVKRLIEAPPDTRRILWPSDVVSFDGEEAVVMKRRAFPQLQTIKQIIYNESMLGLDKPYIKEIISSFLSICLDYDKAGYCYNNYDVENIFYDPSSYELLFNFTFAVSEKDERYAFSSCAEEFLPPWIDTDKKDCLDINSNYYSIAAILFRLIVGRMPYQGANMDTYPWFMNRPDENLDNSLKHDMFLHYFGCPVFIFEENEANAIGALTSEEKYINRWENLPEPIRKAFFDCFCSDNVIPEGKHYALSPSEWKTLFKNNHIL